MAGLVADRLGWPSKGDREIGPFQAVMLKHLDQPLVGLGALRYHHHPAGVLVEPVHDAGAQRIGAALHLGVVQQRVDERAVGVARSGVNHEAGGLVEDDQMVVLEQDLQGNRLGLGAHRLGRRRVNQDLRAIHSLGFPGNHLAGLLYPALLDPALERASREFRAAPSQDAIDALSGVVSG
jgi:hypothetical protein